MKASGSATASFSSAFHTRSLAPGLAKWSPASPPWACWAAIRSQNTADARSTASGGTAPSSRTMPGPSTRAAASSARRPAIPVLGVAGGAVGQRG